MCHPPLPCHQLSPPPPSLLLAITRGDLTPPQRPRSATSVQGTECLGQGHSSHPLRAALCSLPPFLILKCVKCNAPSPPWPRAACPCTARLSGPSSQGVWATLKSSGLPMASPNILGDQMYLMVKGLVPSLAARASERAGGPLRPCACSGLGLRVAHVRC